MEVVISSPKRWLNICRICLDFFVFALCNPRSESGREREKKS